MKCCHVQNQFSSVKANSIFLMLRMITILYVSLRMLGARNLGPRKIMGLACHVDALLIGKHACVKCLKVPQV